VAKLTEDGKKWVRHLQAVVFADRTTVRRSTGLTPFELVFGIPPALPIELQVSSWAYINWEDVKDTEQLLAARARQIERRTEDIALAGANLRQSRLRDAEQHESGLGRRRNKLRKGMLVLMWNRALDNQHGKKLWARWSGPYRLADEGCSGTYALEDLDGAPYAKRIHGNHLKEFHDRMEGRDGDGGGEDDTGDE